MTRSQIHPLPAYFDRYINLCDDVYLPNALHISLQELQQLPVVLYAQLGNQVYATGKWTIKQLLQHMIDTERVLCYRTTAFARGDSQVMLPFNEDAYAQNAPAVHRTIQELVQELIVVRNATIAMFNSYTQDVLSLVGNNPNGSITVHAMGYVIAGHQRWHTSIVNERYMPLLTTVPE